MGKANGTPAFARDGDFTRGTRGGFPDADARPGNQVAAAEPFGVSAGDCRQGTEADLVQVQQNPAERDSAARQGREAARASGASSQATDRRIAEKSSQANSDRMDRGADFAGVCAFGIAECARDAVARDSPSSQKTGPGVCCARGGETSPG